MHIDHIKTDNFSIGTFGRSGSTSIGEFTSNFYSSTVLQISRVKYLYDFDNLDKGEKHVIIKAYDDPNRKHFPELLMMGNTSHHHYSEGDVETFNNYNNFLNNNGPKILTLREPISRAESGARVGFEPNFHGAPVLHLLDFDTIDYILPFEKINDYVNGTNFGDRSDFVPDHNLVSWNVEDYNYDQEVDLYNELVSTKQVLPLDMWKNLLRNYTEINIPSMNPRVRFRKKWDM